MLSRRSWSSTCALAGVLFTTLTVSSSCAGALSGEVAGESVPAFTAAGVLHANVDGVQQWLAYFASAGEGCALLNPLLSNTLTDDAATQVSIFRAHTPERFWYATVSAFATSSSGLTHTAIIDLNAFDTSEGAAVIVCHRNGYPTLNDGVLSVDEDCFYAADGEVRLQYDNDLFDIETRDALRLETPSGEAAGRVDLNGRAPKCDAGSAAFTQLLTEGVNDDPTEPVVEECASDGDCNVLAAATGVCTTTADCHADERCVVAFTNETICVVPTASAAMGCLDGWEEASTTEGDTIGLCGDGVLRCNANRCE